MNKSEVINDIKKFLDGYNNDLKYIVNVETNQNNNIAECIIHEPNKEPRIERVVYEPFMYMKEMKNLGYSLYENSSDSMVRCKRIKYGITITKLKTGGQKRLLDGYCYKITSTKSYNAILNYLKDGGVNVFQKLYDVDGNVVRDNKGKIHYPNRNLFYNVSLNEQFFISKRVRLYKGFEEYKDIHKLTFDIETTGLRYQLHRMFSIGVRDNRGFETILEVDKLNDDESEIRLIQDFFNLIHYIKPAIVCGFNSEDFDFDFILGRAKLLDMDLSQVPTSLKEDIGIKRRGGATFKHGSNTDRYTATEMWGISVIDIHHAAKKTAAVNNELMYTNLKYVSKFEKIAKPNRTYINGEDNQIGRYYSENKIFLINSYNEYIQIPDEYQIIGKKLYELQKNKGVLDEKEYINNRNKYLKEFPKFVKWVKENVLEKKMDRFISGVELVNQYLLDDLWETEQVDALYNQSSFLLAKIIPTTFSRISTMGTASVWNLLLTTWSYENDLAIPIPDEHEKFSGGLARTFKIGFIKNGIKIDYASLYPFIQLTYNVFPIFDITGVMKNMLLYLTTTRNIYKKLATYTELNNEEVQLLSDIDHETFIKYNNNELSDKERASFKIKQLPIKILNNSLFGALGSNISFKWSDNICAAWITCIGRIQLRHAIDWFNKHGCMALLCVTDGVNFNVPEKSNLRINEDGVVDMGVEKDIETMWTYGDKKGIEALIEKFNTERMEGYMSVDNDGEFESCYNIARINYATYSKVKDKKSGELINKIKLTGNSLKSKTMPDYIEDFFNKGIELLLQGKGKEFVDYYYDYVDDIRYMQVPLKKIASKSRMKTTISGYINRGKDKNGREKGKQAHMELLINERNKIAEELFEKHKNEFDLSHYKKDLSISDKMKLVSLYMPPEPELDSTIYYVNIGTRKSHGDTKIIKNKKTGEEYIGSKLISTEDMVNNPEMKGTYNYHKYIDALNKKVISILMGFKKEIREKILVKIDKNENLIKGDFVSSDLELNHFDLDSVDDSMYLEEMEVDFWNRTGYNPKLVWDGFKEKDDYRVFYGMYDEALDYLNDLMKEKNKKKIKSINDKLDKDDLVLIKNGDRFSVGVFNGIYTKIVRDDVEIPKTKTMVEYDEFMENKIGKRKTKEEIDKIAGEKYREMLFTEFKDIHNIPDKFTMEEVFNTIEHSEDVFEEFVNSSLNKNKNDGIIVDTY